MTAFAAVLKLWRCVLKTEDEIKRVGDYWQRSQKIRPIGCWWGSQKEKRRAALAERRFFIPVQMSFTGLVGLRRGGRSVLVLRHWRCAGDLPASVLAILYGRRLALRCRRRRACVRF